MPSTKKSPSTAEKTRREAQSYGSGYTGASFLHDLDCPSGSTVQVKRVGIQGLVKAGILDSLDTLTAIVSGETIPTAEGRQKVDLQKIVENPDQVDTMLEMVDKIVSTVVNQPRFAPRPAANEEGQIVYEDGVAYIDLVPLDDKMFIVNYVVGGTADVADFRAQSAEALGSA